MTYLTLRRLSLLVTAHAACALGLGWGVMLNAGAAAHAAPQKSSPRRPPVHRQPAQAEALAAEGIAALANDEAAARLLFERALKADPDNVTAHTYLGALADRAGDLKEAERHFAAAAALAPRSASARNNYGAILSKVGRKDLAAAEFEASLKLDGDQPNALVNLAQILFAGGAPADLRAARELFERAQRVAPDEEVARALVIVSLRLGEKERAAAHYQDYAARVAAAGQPPSAASRAELGAALAEGGLLGEAVAELEAALALDPADARTVVALGRAHLGRRDIPAAGRVLEAAVARGLDAAPVYAALAEVYEAGGYVENAIPAMRLALKREPQNESYHVRYGLLLNDTKAPAAAVIRLQEALKEFPRSARLWLALGIAQLNDGRNEDAQASFSRSLELDPRSVPALAYLGTAHAERGQLAEAVEYYERAIAADGRGAVPYYLAADALLKFAEADAPRVEKYLKRAVELDPSFAPARFALGRLYVRGERWQEAAAQLEQVVKLDPEFADARYQLGRVYVRLRRQADAKRELDAFQELSRTQKERRETDRRELVRRLAGVKF
jgi:Tfp pilus assembly protein PilF